MNAAMTRIIRGLAVLGRPSLPG